MNLDPVDSTQMSWRIFLVRQFISVVLTSVYNLYIFEVEFNKMVQISVNSIDKDS